MFMDCGQKPEKTWQKPQEHATSTQSGSQSDSDVLGFTIYQSAALPPT